MRKRTIGLIATAVCLGIAAFTAREILQPARVSAREAVLSRQNQALGTLVAEAEAGTLLDFKGVLVTVDQSLVQDLVRSVLPIEADVGGGFLVRINDVESAFGSGVALVRLSGQAKLGPTDVGTRVTVFAAI